MTRAWKIIPLVVIGLLIAAYVLVRSVSVRLSITDEAAALVGNSASIIGIVIAAIAALLLLVWLLSCVRIPARAASTAGALAPQPPQPVRERTPSAPMPWVVRKVIGALFLLAAIFTATYIAYGNQALALVLATVFALAGFNAYDRNDKSLDNLFGVVLLGFISLVFFALAIVFGVTIADALALNAPFERVVGWAVAVCGAMGVHGLFMCADRTRTRNDMNGAERGRLVAVGLAVAVIGLIVVFAFGVL
jgi:hypothetical protein